ncbi:hypothetical protein MRX96_012966 [Rhipicephalus microplus]
MHLIHDFEGCDLLLRLGYISQFHDAARRKPIPDQLRATYKVAPIPRNMDPRLHQGRREARVEALERTYAHKNTTYYVDAANYDHANNKAVATVMDHTLTERQPSFSAFPDSRQQQGRPAHACVHRIHDVLVCCPSAPIVYHRCDSVPSVEQFAILLGA